MNLRLSGAPHIRSRVSTRSLMGNVLIALLPCAAAGVYRFGTDAAIVLLVCMATACITEYVWQKIARRPSTVGDLSAMVTGLILGLNLPSTAPWWMAMVGSFFAIALVKQLFGGIGDNFMNPALAARAILLASWPVRMTAFVLPTNWTGIDAVSHATPLASATGAYSYRDLFLGDVPGCIGETCKALILVGLLYLLITRTISWRIPFAMVGSAFVALWLFGSDPVEGILTGGLLFGAVFMATDYATCPMNHWAQLIYGVGAGLMVALIRTFGQYPEGVTYAILFMNIVAPLLDHLIKRPIYGHGKGAKVNG